MVDQISPASTTARDVREWALFVDWCTATGRDPLPATDDVVDSFLHDVRGARGTQAHRRRAIRRVHAAYGYTTSPARQHVDSLARVGRGWLPLEDAVARTPTYGWPSGLRGRRDAWLLVLACDIRLTRPQIRALTTDQVTLNPVTVAGKAVSRSEDPVTCPACVVIRWLDALSATSTGFRAQAQAIVTSRQVADGEHDCDRGPISGWAGAYVLTPWIDRYGWVGEWAAISERSISAILAARLDATIAPQPLAPPPPSPLPRPVEPIPETTWRRGHGEAEQEMDDLLDALDVAMNEASEALTAATAAIEADLDQIRSWTHRKA